jgi:hypothetical protein
MSHFYLSGRGNRGETTRCGTKVSGISAHVRGWKSGVYIEGRHQEERDEFLIFKTLGSSGGGSSRLIGRVITNKQGRSVFIPGWDKNR